MAMDFTVAWSTSLESWLFYVGCIDGPNGPNGFNGFNSFDGFDGFNATLLMSSIVWKKDANAEHALNRRIQTLKWSTRTPIDWYILPLRRDYSVLSTPSIDGG
ncbi:uncharacterized protein Triagg1_10013 [Trichoderma aggressivum f. europaeum]|uniref:Uncharacterized protein n=1 Tax=Trichoderma aggressivum f. europaeum TaxID=173218 RepID=A0AAE1M059_9HYPO|nr:hypothetical protein Triagg1_10013 [Trichoderma aggressivum f. europaeum]